MADLKEKSNALASIIVLLLRQKCTLGSLFKLMFTDALIPSL